MAENSSFTNVSLLHPNSPSGLYCFFTSLNTFIFMIYYITNILFFLPLFLFVFYLGFQHRQRQRSTSTSATTSHSDSFTYHMVAMELIGVFGATLCFCGVHSDYYRMIQLGYFLWGLNLHGETLFHILTCLERYLAVVHPIAYLSLRGERGIRIRNVANGCVWLLCVAGTTLMLSDDVFFVIDVSLPIFSFIVIVFCSLSVLFVLIRPGPGEQGGDKERVDQSKRRAFYTIVAILGVLLLKCFGNLLWHVLRELVKAKKCDLMFVEIWFNLPSTLVLPLLFLQRSGVLACCKNNPNKDKD